MRQYFSSTPTGIRQPHPIGVGPIGGNMSAIVTLYVYGEGAAEAGVRDDAQLTGWLKAYGETVPS